jgi:hypothetical protein
MNALTLQTSCMGVSGGGMDRIFLKVESSSLLESLPSDNSALSTASMSASKFSPSEPSEVKSAQLRMSPKQGQMSYQNYK